MRRGITAIAATALAASLTLTACGGESESGGSKADDGTVTLDWQMWAGSEDEKAQLDHLAGLVTEKYPDIKIKLRTAPFGNYFTKLQTEFAADKQACLVSMQSLRLAGYTDLLEPLNDHVDTDGFDAAALGALNIDDQQLAMPYDLGSMLMYYNKDAFKDADLPEPKADWTIEEFEKAAEKLTTGDKAGFGMSFADLHSLSMLLSYNGATPVDKDVKLQFNDDKMAEAAEWYAGLAEKAASVPASSSDVGWGETQFVNGNAMMAVDGSWNLGSNMTQAKFDVGVVPLPAGPDGSKTYVANSGYGVSKSCAFKEEAYKALEVLTGPEALKYVASEGRGFPARTEQQADFLDFLVKQDPDNEEAVTAAMTSLQDSVAGGVPLFTTKNWDDVSKLMGQYLIEAYTGATTATEALDSIQQKGERNQ